MKNIGREGTSSKYHGSYAPYCMKKLFAYKKFYKFNYILILIVFSLTITLAQEKTLPTVNRVSLAFMNPNQLIVDTTGSNTSAIQDSLPPVDKPRLLPENISWGENLLWGENGIVRKWGIEPPLSPEERMSEIRLRRTMLTMHQIGGFTTLALMLTADYFGQRVIDGDRQLGGVHQGLITATILSYGATGLLAVLSPPPLIRRDEGGTIVIHKTLAWIHLIGMIVTPILGSTIRHRRVFNMDQAHFHQIAGYLTTAVFATSMLVIVF